MSEQPQTWHYGLMAEWWSHFNTDVGEELAYFQPFVEAGQPALDAGCGNGRLFAAVAPRRLRRRRLRCVRRHGRPVPCARRRRGAQSDTLGATFACARA